MAAPDLTQCATFAERAAEFTRGARLQADRGDPAAQGHILQSLCVGLELAFKAFLLARGRSDDWNRREIRHDLAKAAAAATEQGLAAPAPALIQLIDVVGPAYARHRLDELPALDIGLPEAVWLVEGQLAAIVAALPASGSPFSHRQHDPVDEDAHGFGGHLDRLNVVPLDPVSGDPGRRR